MSSQVPIERRAAAFTARAGHVFREGCGDHVVSRLWQVR